MRAESARREQWIESSFEVEGQQIGVSVRRLGDDERQRMAAQLAWFAQGVTNGIDPSAMKWQEFFQTILDGDVAVTLDEAGVDQASGFWDEVLRRTFEVFIRANQLGPVVKMSLGLHR